MNYSETKPDVIVSVLGTNYGIYLDVSEDDDETLKECAGYCDKTTKRICVGRQMNSNLGDYSEYRKYIIRHELIHAFLFESGIGADTTWDIEGQEHPEHMVEWVSMQFPKMVKAFQEAGVL